MFKRFKINCNQATTICDKNQYGEATLFEKLKLSIHFIRCKICIKYTKQNTTLTKLYKGQANACKNLKHCMSHEDKLRLKKEVEKIKE